MKVIIVKAGIRLRWIKIHTF